MPKNFVAEWKNVKDGFTNRARDVPLEFMAALDLGYNFGPALKAFDVASSHEARMKAMPKVLQAKAAYEEDILAALKKTSSRIGKAGLTALMNNLDRILREVELASQPPRPSGQMVSTYTLRGFDLAAGVKTVFLKVNPIPITVDIECDKVFKELIDSGQAGLRAQELGDAALKELEIVRDAFRKTIISVEAKIADDPSILAAKTVEANEVLRHYGTIVQDRVDVATQAAWKGYLQRRSELKGFKSNSRVKIVLGSIGVGVAIASAVLSFGTAWMNIVAACKGIVEIGKAIQTYSKDIDTVWAELVKDMESVNKLNAQRDAAKKDGKGQKASKGKQIAKELVSGMLPFTKDMVKALSTTEARAKQFNGLLSKLEAETDKMSGKIEVITKNLGKTPDRLLSTSQINLDRRMGKKVTEMMKDIAELHQKKVIGVKFANSSLASIKELKTKDTWTGQMGDTCTYGTRGVAAFAAANFMWALSHAGKQLIKMH